MSNKELRRWEKLRITHYALNNCEDAAKNIQDCPTGKCDSDEESHLLFLDGNLSDSHDVFLHQSAERRTAC